ncbi:MAG: DUF1761 domain-containing protein [Chitinophagaceae bacterium]
MEMQEAFSHLNWLAIFVAAVSIFLIGGIWYSLFENQWMAANNFSKEYLQQRNLSLVFGLSFLFSFIMSFNLAMFIGTKATISFGMIAGFLTGFGWVFFSIAIISLFEKRSLKYILINGGYMIIAFTVMGTILGAWH